MFKEYIVLMAQQYVPTKRVLRLVCKDKDNDTIVRVVRPPFAGT
jgi:hypothetical protein